MGRICKFLEDSFRRTRSGRRRAMTPHPNPDGTIEYYPEGGSLTEKIDAALRRGNLSYCVFYSGPLGNKQQSLETIQDVRNCYKEVRERGYKGFRVFAYDGRRRINDSPLSRVILNELLKGDLSDSSQG